MYQINENVTQYAIHKQKVGYSEFWAPIREGKLGELFVGKSVPIRNDRSVRKDIRNIGVELYITNQRCCIRLHFKDADRRKEIMTLFPESDYTWEYRDSPKAVKVIFPVLNKGKNDRDDWDEIREKLVGMGTDIFNKIRESGDDVF
ncbi:hypothetical protein C6501_05400 [Candidatus Poribacteria bacterium]|nr:MAG: hypothetical protein C6501_05400 [Candidatus Poribacteria bacterium]